MEFWTVDEYGRLCPCEDISSDLDFAEPEFVEPLLEIKSTPCNSVEEVREELKWKIEEALEKADDADKKLVPLGTPLNAGPINHVESDRSEIQRKVVGDNIEYAKRVAGLHFHFEQTDPVEQMKILTSLDPALAVANSSPYIQGKPLASSSRIKSYRDRCYRDFPKHGQLWSYSKLESWEENATECYETFREKSLEKGVTEKRFEDNFKPEDSLWTPIRLRKEFNTIEWRSPDITLPSKSLKLLKNIKKVLEIRNEDDLPEFGEVKKVSREAIDSGLTYNVQNYLESIGFESGDTSPESEKIPEKSELSKEEASRIRLKYGKKLQKDVENL